MANNIIMVLILVVTILIIIGFYLYVFFSRRGQAIVCDELQDLVIEAEKKYSEVNNDIDKEVCKAYINAFKLAKQMLKNRII